MSNVGRFPSHDGVPPAPEGLCEACTAWRTSIAQVEPREPSPIGCLRLACALDVMRLSSSK